MNIEDYTIDASAFAGLINAVKASSDSLESFNGAVTNAIYELTNNGVNVFGNDGNILFHTDDAGSIWVIPTTEKPIKVVFDNGIQIVDESEPDYAEDYDTATDEEIEALIGID
jgi:hypothetical protein